MLITLDSTRADRMGFLGAKGALMPNLDRLAAESIVFEHAYAQSPASVVSHATILSGAYPQSTGMSAIGGTCRHRCFISRILLRAQGYRTAAFVGSIDLDPVTDWHKASAAASRHTTLAFGPRSPEMLVLPVTERRGDQVVAGAVAWLDHNAQGQGQGSFFYGFI